MGKVARDGGVPNNFLESIHKRSAAPRFSIRFKVSAHGP
ncbi:MAG: hypothetical protein [Olavius algarvensis Gamma 1 endosymbiont]|nr:MAG: hypothetical protein [Olavius algarvensis Gamma 1 endosymbiont]